MKTSDVNIAHVEYKKESDTSNNVGSWNHLKIIHQILKQHAWKTRNQETIENSHTGHCTHTAESSKTFHVGYT